MGIKAADLKDELRFMENGEGSLTEGDGTAQRPYQNIRTALKQIQTGQTLVLCGVKSPTPNTRRCEDGSPKPLFIDKRYHDCWFRYVSRFENTQYDSIWERMLRFVIMVANGAAKCVECMGQQFMRRDIRRCWMR